MLLNPKTEEWKRRNNKQIQSALTKQIGNVSNHSRWSTTRVERKMGPGAHSRQQQCLFALVLQVHSFPLLVVGCWTLEKKTCLIRYPPFFIFWTISALRMPKTETAELEIGVISHFAKTRYSAANYRPRVTVNQARINVSSIKQPRSKLKTKSKAAAAATVFHFSWLSLLFRLSWQLGMHKIHIRSAENSKRPCHWFLLGLAKPPLPRSKQSEVKITSGFAMNWTNG